MNKPTAKLSRYGLAVAVVLGGMLWSFLHAVITGSPRSASVGMWLLLAAVVLIVFAPPMESE